MVEKYNKNLSNQVRALHNEIRDLKYKLNFVPQDHLDFIVDKKNMTAVLKHNGVYYPSHKTAALSAALRRQGVDVSARTLRDMMGRNDKIEELWAMSVELIYLKETKIGFIASDGMMLHKNFRPYIGSLLHTGVLIQIDGVSAWVNRAVTVMEYFMAHKGIKEDEIMWINGVFGECAVWNLRKKDFSKHEDVNERLMEE